MQGREKERARIWPGCDNEGCRILGHLMRERGRGWGVRNLRYANLHSLSLSSPLRGYGEGIVGYNQIHRFSRTVHISRRPKSLNSTITIHHVCVVVFIIQGVCLQSDVTLRQVLVSSGVLVGRSASNYKAHYTNRIPIVFCSLKFDYDSN